MMKKIHLNLFVGAMLFGSPLWNTPLQAMEETEKEILGDGRKEDSKQPLFIEKQSKKETTEEEKELLSMIKKSLQDMLVIVVMNTEAQKSNSGFSETENKEQTSNINNSLNSMAEKIEKQYENYMINTSIERKNKEHFIGELDEILTEFFEKVRSLDHTLAPEFFIEYDWKPVQRMLFIFEKIANEQNIKFKRRPLIPIYSTPDEMRKEFPSKKKPKRRIAIITQK